MEHKIEVWYRYREIFYSIGVDDYGDPIPGIGRIEIRLEEYPVIKKTPCGAWIETYFERRFVNLNWNKRFAVPTIDEARKSFIARKKREIQLMESRAKTARRSLAVASDEWCV